MISPFLGASALSLARLVAMDIGARLLAWALLPRDVPADDAYPPAFAYDVRLDGVSVADPTGHESRLHFAHIGAELTVCGVLADRVARTSMACEVVAVHEDGDGACPVCLPVAVAEHACDRARHGRAA